jgi:hypothetical protein
MVLHEEPLEGQWLGGSGLRVASEPAIATTAVGLLRASDFGLLSGFGLRLSDFTRYALSR